MSQHSSSALTNGASLPVIKYSWSTDRDQHGGSQWNHIYRDDIFLVFDPFSSFSSVAPGKQQLLKIVQGPEVVELVQLEMLIALSNKARDDARQQMAQIAIDQLPVHGLYKRATCSLAFKYRSDNGKFRRMQVKLRSVPDFDQAIDYLTSIGCPIIDTVHTQGATRRPSSRPASSQSTLTVGAPAQPATLGHFYQEPAHVAPPERLTEFRTTAQHQAHSSSFPTHSFDAAQDETKSRPAAALSSSYMNPMHRNISHVPCSTPNTPQYPLTDLRTSIGDTFDMPPPRQIASAGRHEHKPITTALPTSEQTTTSKFFSSYGNSSERPSTAPLMQGVPMLTAEMPPRRELPFKSSSSARSIGSSGNDGLSRGSSVNELPPLRQPKVRDASSGGRPLSAATEPKATSRSRKTKPQPQSMDINSISRTTEVPSIVPSSAAYSSSPPTIAANAKRQDPRVNTSTPCPDRGDIRTPLQPTSGNVRTSSEIRNQIETGRAAPYTTGSIQQPVMRQLFNNNNGEQGGNSAFDHVLQRAAEPANQDENTLSNYASQSDEERKAVLGEMICNLVEDDNFKKLMEDVECCWERIGLSTRQR
ncbi:MAG: hypothetical protein M1820_003797 [Bogoriella megaspora]|nr:MAG: hypothetical protein M1820_003797 [Bogoriella megaspora]